MPVMLAVMLKHGLSLEDDVTPTDAMRAEAYALFDRLSNETQDMISQHWPSIERVAVALLEKRFLASAEVDTLIA